MAVDLERRGLPRHIVVDGQPVEVVTDFRAWIRFGRLLEEARVCDPHVLAGFPDEVPDGPWQAAAVEFWQSPTSTPRHAGDDRARALDPSEDGDLLVAAFMQAYGIDLTACEMHWHKFRALLRGLPDDTRMAQVMGWRTWEEADDRVAPADRRRELRAAWELRDREDEAELLRMQRELFGR